MTAMYESALLQGRPGQNAAEFNTYAFIMLLVGTRQKEGPTAFFQVTAIDTCCQQPPSTTLGANSLLPQHCQYHLLWLSPELYWLASLQAHDAQTAAQRAKLLYAGPCFKHVRL